MSEHTPGPWEYNADFDEVQSPMGLPVICKLRTAHGPREDVMQANARLIVAAPELMDVLLELGECVWEGDNSQGFRPKDGVSVATLERLRAVVKRVRGTA